METFYSDHEGVIQIIAIFTGILIGYISVVQPILNYTKAQKKVNNDKRFEVYHNLIDHFAGANGTAKLDRQIAIVYEMRRFPEYFPLTKRIFTDWKNGILQNSVNPNIQRLITEIDITLEFINSNWYKRKYSFKDK